MRLLAALLLFPVVLFGATESVSIDTKTKKVQNPIVNFGAGNTLNGTGATIIGFPGSSYTFINSLTQIAGNVSLVNDSASPGNSKYYGTDSGGVLGFYTVTGDGGSFLSANIARVDPSGNDGTGTVGDLNKPFLTVQAAIDAAAALPSPIPSFATIQVGLNHFTEATTINFRSPKIVFEGVSAGNSQPFDSLTFGTADGATAAYFYNCSVGTITQTGNTQMTIGLFASVLRGDITGDHIYVKAYAGSWADSITIFGTSDASIDVRGLGWDALDEEIFPSITGHRFSISTPTANGNSVTLWKSVAFNVTTNSLQITDSIIQNNNFAVTTDITDNWFDPSRFDFSELPTSDPDDGIHAWRSKGIIRFGATPTATPTSTPTPTATATASATATATPTPTPTATAFPQGFTAHFYRGGAPIQANDVTITPWTTRYPGTITGFIISADQGTCTLKVWKRATGTAIPTIANVINTSGVSLATGTHIDSTTVTDFTTTTVSVGDQFMAQVTAVSGGATDITFQIPIRQ